MEVLSSGCIRQGNDVIQQHCVCVGWDGWELRVCFSNQLHCTKSGSAYCHRIVDYFLRITPDALKRAAWVKIACRIREQWEVCAIYALECGDHLRTNAGFSGILA
eukprot:2674439-Rhodomonas_salina.1